MPFTYDVTLKGNDLREDSIIFDSWVSKPLFSRFRYKKLITGQVFAYAHDNLGKIKLLANGDAFLLKKIIKKGQQISSEDIIAVFAADGENIPYGKPYCIAKYQ